MRTPPGSYDNNGDEENQRSLSLAEEENSPFKRVRDNIMCECLNYGEKVIQQQPQAAFANAKLDNCDQLWKTNRRANNDPSIDPRRPKSGGEIRVRGDNCAFRAFYSHSL